MAEQGYGNFAFMYDINQDIYELLALAEKNARINIRLTGNPIRQALEMFLNDLLVKYHLEAHMDLDSSLSDKLRFMGSQRELRDCGFLAPDQTLRDKHLLPFDRYHYAYRPDMDYAEYMCKPEPGQKPEVKRDGYYFFLRMLGNAFSHSGERPGEPMKNFYNVTLALEIMHKILRSAYGVKGVSNFDRNKMPIGEFLIEDTRIPGDSSYSGCLREFDGYTVDGDGNLEFHALLRLYPRQRLDENFISRNRTCFVYAAKNSPLSVPGGMARMRVLTDHSSKNEFYIVAYIFNHDAQPLSDKVLKNMTLRERKAFCTTLMQYVRDLHASDTPIYHRLLNYQCIWVARYKDSWLPYIVKFDYAKIDHDPVVTIREQAENANSQLQKQPTLAQYIPPEWKRRDGAPVDWAKVDVYSLGHLIIDILYGAFTPFAPEQIFEALGDMGVAEDILEILAAMCSDDPGERCSLADAIELFREVSQ